MGERKLINPFKLDLYDLPLVVLVDDRCGGFITSRIKAHSGGNYNHVMEFHRKGYFATQDFNGYREVENTNYMKSRFFLKFWYYKKITPVQRELWTRNICNDFPNKNDKLSVKLKKWFKNGYDYIGIGGQLLYSIFKWPVLKKINNPWKRYCSERVAFHIMKSLLIHIPQHDSPSALNEYFNASPDWDVLGYWFID